MKYDNKKIAVRLTVRLETGAPLEVLIWGTRSAYIGYHLATKHFKCKPYLSRYVRVIDPKTNADATKVYKYVIQAWDGVLIINKDSDVY